ncbi:MAG: hypothetical protein ACREQD_12990 [Candidatus Binataceae bacterium]
MNLKLTLRDASDHAVAGTLEWDSTTGRLAGTLEPRIARRIDLAQHLSFIGWGPDYCLQHLVSDPLRKPEEFALVLDSMGFILPPELEAVYPEPTDDLLHDPDLDDLSPAERARVQY